METPYDNDYPDCVVEADYNCLKCGRVINHKTDYKCLFCGSLHTLEQLIEDRENEQIEMAIDDARLWGNE